MSLFRRSAIMTSDPLPRHVAFDIGGEIVITGKTRKDGATPVRPVRWHDRLGWRIRLHPWTEAARWHARYAREAVRMGFRHAWRKVRRA